MIIAEVDFTNQIFKPVKYSFCNQSPKSTAFQLIDELLDVSPTEGIKYFRKKQVELIEKMGVDAYFEYALEHFDECLYKPEDEEKWANGTTL